MMLQKGPSQGRANAMALRPPPQAPSPRCLALRTQQGAWEGVCGEAKATRQAGCAAGAGRPSKAAQQGRHLRRREGARAVRW